MVEVIGKQTPVNVFKTATNEMMDLDEDEDDSDIYGHDVDEKEAMARMKIICQFAREVLLSHVKKDVNLTVYPGSIQFPGELYTRALSSSPLHVYDDDESPKKRKPKKSISHYVQKNNTSAAGDKLDEDDESEFDEKATDDKSDGSSEQEKDDLSGGIHDRSQATSPAGSDIGQDFGDVSPIAKAKSPTPMKKEKAQGKKTTDRKRKSEVDVFDEYPSPATDGDGSSVSGKGSHGGKPPSAKKRKSTPRAGSGRKQKSKATPVSVPKKITLVNVTNSAGSAGSSEAAAPSRKKRVAPRKKSDDELDFSDSPMKRQASRKKSASASSEKAAPARKTKAPSKAKISVGSGKVGAVRGNRRTPKASPSTTSEGSSRASPVQRGARRGVRSSRS